MNSYFKVIAENRKAFHDFNILEKLEAGLELKGAEVKSIRAGNISLKESFAKAEKDSLWLYACHINPYGFSAKEAFDPLRVKKLLLKKTELRKTISKLKEKGLVAIPLKVYFKGNWAKVVLGLAKPKKLHQKREALKEKTVKREIEKAFSQKG